MNIKYCSSVEPKRISAEPFIIGLLGLTLLVLSQLSYAQTVQPMIFELEPIGSRSSQNLRVTNTNARPITVEIEAFKLDLDEFGNESNIPADDDFLIYPPQSIIEGDSSQLIKVKYIGDPTIDVSKAYRVSVTQLPVDLKAAGSSGVSILSRFLTLVNVSPKKTRAELSVTAISPSDDGKWSITIENTGNRFSRLSETRWEMKSNTDSKAKQVFGPSEIADMVSQFLVLPKSKLTVSIPAPEGFEAESTTIEIKRS